jgi:hypothetical protein
MVTQFFRDWEAGRTSQLVHLQAALTILQQENRTISVEPTEGYWQAAIWEDDERILARSINMDDEVGLADAVIRLAKNVVAKRQVA